MIINAGKVIYEDHQLCKLSNDNQSREVVLTEDAINKFRRLVPQIRQYLIGHWPRINQELDKHYDEFYYRYHCIGIYSFIVDEKFLIDDISFTLSAIVPATRPTNMTPIYLFLEKSKAIGNGIFLFNGDCSYWEVEQYCTDECIFTQQLIRQAEENIKHFSLQFSSRKEKIFSFTVDETFRPRDIVCFTKNTTVDTYIKQDIHQQYNLQHLTTATLSVPEGTKALVYKTNQEMIHVLCRYYDGVELRYKKLYLCQNRQDIERDCCFLVSLNELQKKCFCKIDNEERYKFFIRSLQADQGNELPGAYVGDTFFLLFSFA